MICINFVYVRRVALIMSRTHIGRRFKIVCDIFLRSKRGKLKNPRYCWTDKLSILLTCINRYDSYITLATLLYSTASTVNTDMYIKRI